MLVRLYIIVSTLFLLSTTAFTQKNNSSFLYTITGNELKKPSYLYGTVHLSDKRLFNFPKQLYDFIEACDGFAMEVHPDSILEKSIDYEIMEKESPTIKELVGAEEFKKLKAEFSDEFDKSFELVTTEDVYRKSSSYYKKGKGNMSTFMDMYLMSLARDRKKKIYGLEDMASQIKLLASMKNGEDIVELLRSIKKDDALTNNLINQYIEVDTIALQKIYQNYSADFKEKLLFKRNAIMVTNMIRLFENGSLFTAIGAAHLHGNKGVIDLLRKQGYTVTEVIAKERVHASNYKLQSISSDSFQVFKNVDEGYEILMPDIPKKNTINNAADMYSVVNWSTNTFMAVTRFPAANMLNASNRDSVLQIIANGSYKSITGHAVVKTESIVKSGLNGKECFFQHGKQFTKIVLLACNTDVFMLMITSQNKASLFDKEAETFFNSLKIFEKQKKPLPLYKDKEELFSVLVPQGQLELDSSQTETIRKNYIAVDNLTGNEFLVTASRCKVDYVFNDKQLKKSLIEIYKTIIDTTREWSIHDTLWNNYPSFSLNAYSKKDHIIKTKFIQRGNRYYHLWSFCNKKNSNNAVVDSFYSSFTILPIPIEPIQMAKKDSMSLGFFKDSILFRITDNEPDSSTILSYWPATGSTLSISSTNINKFLWFTTDSMLLTNAAYHYYTSTEIDSIIRTYSYYRTYPCLDIYAKTKSTHMLEFTRLIKYGNKIVEISIHIEPELSVHETFNELINSIIPNKTLSPLNKYYKTPQEIFDDISNLDSTDFSNLISSFEILPFTRQHLSLLLSNGTRLIERDSSKYETLQEKIWDRIKSIADSSKISLIQQAYNEADSNGHAQEWAVETLLKIGTAKSLQLIKNNIPFTKQKNVTWHTIITELIEKKECLSIFFPQWLSLIKDTLYGIGVLRLLNAMQETGRIDEPKFFEKDLIILGSWLFNKISHSEEYVPYYNAVFESLAKQKSKETIALLQSFSKLKGGNLYYAMSAVRSMINEGIDVDIATLENLCEEPYYRIDLYDILKNSNIEAKFPKKFLTQEKMAEAYMHYYVDEPDTIIYFNKFTVIYKNSIATFYTYKIGYYEEDSLNYFLGFSGPFFQYAKSSILDTDNITQETDIPFNPKKVKEDLLDFLRKSEESKDD